MSDIDYEVAYNLLMKSHEILKEQLESKLTTLRKELDALIEKNQKGYDYTISQDSRFSAIYYTIIENLKKLQEML